MNLLRSIAAGGALLMLASCNLTTEAITQMPYAPSDGIRVHLESDVIFENLMVVSDGSGSGVLYGSISNRSAEDVEAVISSDDIDETFSVDARDSINLGTMQDIEDGSLITLEGDFAPGSNLRATVSGGGAQSPAAIPVISACSTDYVDAFPFEADCD